MPPLRQQLDLIPLDLLGPERALVARWMLHQGLVYEAAVERYEPFDRVVDPDPGSRSEIAALAQRALQLGRGMIVVVNNKAEGSAPLSVVALAEAISQFVEEGGQPARLARYAANCATLIEGMGQLGLRPFLQPEHQVPIIVTFHAPAHPSYDFQRRFMAEDSHFLATADLVDWWRL